jgi:hypothetical protein
MTTSTGATPSSVLRNNRAALALGAALLAVLAVLAAITAGGASGYLDPDAYNPEGAHAASVLLEDRGVDVRRVTDLPSTVAQATRDSTVFVPLSLELSSEELALLQDLPGRVVLASGLDPSAVIGTAEVDGQVDVSRRDPDCPLEAAVNAGRAEVGGFTYRGVGVDCYDRTLLADAGARRVLVGDGEWLSNDHLDEEGNAALMLGLLGRTSTLLWLMPDPDRPAIGTRQVDDPADLLPPWVGSVGLQLFLALLVLALWRARRLGRVVPEPLPVVVPAAETTEGRGRLYRAAGARDTAAESLRSGARERLAMRLGAGSRPSPEVLTALVAARVARPDAEVQGLLYGPQPADDAALVRLADELDSLTQEVASS